MIFRMLKNVMTRSKLELGVHEAKKNKLDFSYKNRGIRLIRHLGESLIRGPNMQLNEVPLMPSKSGVSLFIVGRDTSFCRIAEKYQVLLLTSDDLHIQNHHRLAAAMPIGTMACVL